MNIGLNKEMIKASTSALNNLLSDHFVLLAKTWNFHWNLKGAGFYGYHKFMQELYDALIEDIDEIAERIRALDQRPIGSLKDSLSHNRIKEYPGNKALPNDLDMLKILGEDYDTLIREIRKDLQNLEAEGNQDTGTISFLEGMIERKEKTAWMIRSFY